MQEYQHISQEETDTFVRQTFSLRRGRALVLTFYGCCLACLLTLWFSGVLISAPDQLISVGFLQFMADHFLVLIGLPVGGMLICYLALRRLTAQILATPVRYLDERQCLLRDQAHLGAFRIIKGACLLIPLLFLLPYLQWSQLPWSNHDASTTLPARISALNAGAQAFAGPLEWRKAATSLINTDTVFPKQTGPILAFTYTYTPAAPVSPVMIAVAAGILLLCLFFMLSALPMSVLTWKGKTS